MITLSIYFLKRRQPQSSTLFPYTTLFRSVSLSVRYTSTPMIPTVGMSRLVELVAGNPSRTKSGLQSRAARSEEHTSELQSRRDLVCRLLLEKKKQKSQNIIIALTFSIN